MNLKNSYSRANNMFIEAIQKGYKPGKYRVINNIVFIKNDIDKKIVLKTIFDLIVTRDLNSVYENLKIFL